MSGRTNLRGNAMPGGRIEYRGDLPNIVASNYDPMRTTSVGQQLRVPASSVRTRSAVVDRHERRGGIENFYTHGAVPMRRPIPGLPAYGSVIRSAFQRFNVRLAMWQLVPSLFEAGYPRNLGLSTKVAQPEVNATGGPGSSMMTQKPIFPAIQQVTRARATIPMYRTRGQ